MSRLLSSIHPYRCLTKRTFTTTASPRFLPFLKARASHAPHAPPSPPPPKKDGTSSPWRTTLSGIEPEPPRRTGNTCSFVPSSAALEWRIRESAIARRHSHRLPPVLPAPSPPPASVSSSWLSFASASVGSVPMTLEEGEGGGGGRRGLGGGDGWTSMNNWKREERLLRTIGRREDNWTVRCTVLDQHGNVTKTESMSKTDICSQTAMQPRDLRKIDSRVPNVVPAILIRSEGILFNALHIRALIKADSVILFDTASVFPTASGSLHSAFLYNLSNNLRSSKPDTNDLPYEFRAIEAMLSSVASNLEGELSILRTLVGEMLEGLESDIEREKLKMLLVYSRRLTSFNRRALLVQECLDEILESDEDMAAAYLTDKKEGRPRAENDHEELEQLIESFSKYVEEQVNEGKSLLTNIKSTEEIIELILDSNRNTLLALDLKVSILTAGLGSGALIASLFGMNLSTSLETSPYAFATVTGVALVGVGLFTAVGLRRLYRLRRVGLSGRGLGGGQGHGVLDWEAPVPVGGNGQRWWQRGKRVQ